MAQNLYYTPASSSLVLIKDNDLSPIYWYDVDRLEISGSAYDATVSGSDFGGTVASARIYAYSGSVELVSFPLEDTNLFYPPFPFPLTIADFYTPVSTTSSFSSLTWNLTIDNTFTSGVLSGSGISVYDLTTSSSYLSYSQESANGGFPVTFGDNYLITVSGSGSYNAYLFINNITSGSTLSLSSSNTPISTSFTPVEFNNYEIDVYIENPTGSVYLANQYNQCGICNVVSSSVIVQSLVGNLSLLKYYLADDGYAYEILSTTSGSGITTISDGTSYPDCVSVPCP